MSISYILKRSKRKTISMKVSNGVIYVYAPMLAPKFLIDNFVAKNGDWINKQLANPRINVNYDLESDKQIYLLGHKYNLVIELEAKSQMLIRDNTIYLSGKSISSIKKNYKEYLIGICNRYVEEIKNKTGKDFEVNYRLYKSKWGCCYRSKKLIIINYLCACLPIDVIKEVIYHEIAHLKVSNHQKPFYEELEKLYPDYRKQVKILKGYTIE